MTRSLMIDLDMVQKDQDVEDSGERTQQTKNPDEAKEQRKNTMGRRSPLGNLLTYKQKKSKNEHKISIVPYQVLSQVKRKRESEKIRALWGTQQKLAEEDHIILSNGDPLASSRMAKFDQVGSKQKGEDRFCCLC